MMAFQLTVTCPRAQKALDKTNYIQHLQHKNSVQAVLVNLCFVRGLRFFIREEIGVSQHVAWIGEEEIKAWGNSHIKTHFNWTMERRKNEKMGQRVSRETKLTNK